VGALDGKVAIVTGASRGIGAAIAQRLAAEGGDVAVVARTATPGASHLDGSLAETVARVEAAGGRGVAVAADLAAPDFDATAVVATVERELGPVDVLVHNAAACFYLPWEQVTPRRYDVMFAVNVHATWKLATAVLPGMCARGRGHVVNLSTAVVPHPPGPPFPTFHAEHGATLYGTTKAALERMSTGLAAEVHRHGVAVNVVLPVAAVATPGTLALGLVPEIDAAVEPVEQMAEAVLALASTDPRSVSGRIVTSAAILAELDRPVRNLDGSERAS
jgi:NAD(P)-dependent dehydrogenase (short-subunit alcohol dehydrogenase family)